MRRPRGGQTRQVSPAVVATTDGKHASSGMLDVVRQSCIKAHTHTTSCVLHSECSTREVVCVCEVVPEPFSFK